MGKECLQMLAGDDAPTADLAVSELAGAHLVVEEVTREPSNRHDFVHRVSESLDRLHAGRSVRARARHGPYDGRVPDQKPPRVDAGERETLLALLQYQRDSLVRKVADVDDAAAQQPVVGSGTTLLWLVKHLTRAEILWVVCRFAGQDVTVPDEALQPGDTVTSAISGYRAAWAQGDAIALAASLGQPCRQTSDDAPVNLRWVLMHLLEETARHAGHADILRELIDGSTGR
jgi:Protein of unknown function (DUF664)